MSAQKQTNKQITYRIRFFEYDCDNGEYIVKEPWETIKVRSKSELIEVLEEWVKEEISEAEEWDCEADSSAENSVAYLCYKDGSLHIVGYDFERVS